MESLPRDLINRALRLLQHAHVPPCDLRAASKLLAEAADWRESEAAGYRITEEDRLVAADGRA